MRPSTHDCHGSTCQNSSSRCTRGPASACRLTHASEGGARAADIATTVRAVLLAEATNTGFEPLVRLDLPSLRRSRLSWVKQNAVPLARSWGGGEVASADGLRLVVPVRTIHSGPRAGVQPDQHAARRRALGRPGSRLAGSLKLGVVRAAGLTRRLQSNDRPTRLARALQELGRLVKTLYPARASSTTRATAGAS